MGAPQENRIARSKEVLQIEAICQHLLDSVQTVILVPHQDLHRFPLHALFPEHLSPLVRKMRGRRLAATQDFIVAGFALGSAIALFRVLIEVTTDQTLHDLEWDGTVAICISAGLGIFLSLKAVVLISE